MSGLASKRVRGVATAASTAPSSHVLLNVGGTRYTTLLSTLTSRPDSMLAAMFRQLQGSDRADTSPDGWDSGDDTGDCPQESGGSLESYGALSLGGVGLTKDASGHILIDRDGPSFRYVLNYLRNGPDPRSCLGGEGGGGCTGSSSSIDGFTTAGTSRSGCVLPRDPEAREQLALEADYYLLPDLADRCRAPVRVQVVRAADVSPADLSFGMGRGCPPQTFADKVNEQLAYGWELRGNAMSTTVGVLSQVLIKY